MKKTMFDIIKKQNGERFAKAIRNYDSGIFDIPNIDKIVRYAGRDAEPIMNYLISLKNIKIIEKKEHQDPIELLDKAGYNAYVVHNLAEQNAISGYFEPSERLCTFSDDTRFKRYYIINAVRKDVDNIRRADFDKPMREDKYGTSVISIQILKSGGFISIKNRYNHTVSNPDNTFNSCPDNIIDGLSDALRSYFNVDFSAQKTDLPEGYVLQNNRIIKYNYEHNNIYVGDGFYASDGNITEINKSSEILLDTILFNLQTKECRDVTQFFYKDVYSERLFKKVTKDKKISIRKNSDKTYSFFADNIQIAVLSESKIISLTLPGIKEINEVNNFGFYIRSLNLPDVEVINDNFFTNNECLSEFIAPKLKVIRNNCFEKNKELRKLELPELEKIGISGFLFNEILSELYLPKLKVMRSNCFFNNLNLNRLDFPYLESMGMRCFYQNMNISDLNTPNLLEMDDECFRSNEKLSKLELPKLVIMGADCFNHNEKISELFLPKLKIMKTGCFSSNLELKRLDLPSLERIGSMTFYKNAHIYEFNAPNLQIMERDVLKNNIALRSVNFPKLKVMYEKCFENNKNLLALNLPNLKAIGPDCFKNNTFLYKEIYKHVNDSGEVKNGGIVIDALESYNKIVGGFKAINSQKTK